jgi:saccharopine dehydrogenase-like NADP-dependent oxidoreductase
MTEEGFRQLGDAEDILMMVGGIPANPTNPPLNYEVTWSYDGLINEYRDDCKILKDGEIQTVKGMAGLSKVQGTEIGDLEAFYTSGGISHTLEDMKKRGVKNCAYKTLRYPGHRDAVRFLFDHAELSKDCLKDIFQKGCAPKEDSGDVVVIASIVKTWPLTWKRWVIIKGESHTGGFSAMQKATAFPIASVASMMGEGLLDSEARKQQRRDYYEYPPNVLTYKDIKYDELIIRLKKLGISNG